jgi:hypothetical protein
MTGWEIPMVISGGLFAGGASYFAWERIPAWRTMSAREFKPDFAHSIRLADRLQPALLVACLASAIGFAASADSPARTVAMLGAGGLLLTLVGSGALLVPLQRRLLAGRGGGDIGTLRRRWNRGHLLRTAAALVSFTLVVVAASL